MAEVVYNTIFKFKRGQSEAWTRVNPILAEAEPGYELDTGKLKIGNGTTPWNDLLYFGGDYSISADNKSITISASGLELYGYSTASVGQIPKKSASGLNWVDDDEPLTKEEISAILV